VSIQKLSRSKVRKPVLRGSMMDVTPCQPIKYIVYMSVSRQIMELMMSLYTD